MGTFECPCINKETLLCLGFVTGIYSQTPAARACALGLLLISFCGVAAAQGDSPTQLRQFIDQQVGGNQ